MLLLLHVLGHWLLILRVRKGVFIVSDRLEMVCGCECMYIWRGWLWGWVRILLCQRRKIKMSLPSQWINLSHYLPGSSPVHRLFSSSSACTELHSAPGRTLPASFASAYISCLALPCTKAASLLFCLSQRDLLGNRCGGSSRLPRHVWAQIRSGP